MTTLTDAQAEAFRIAMDAMVRSHAVSIDRMKNLKFSDDELTFESCAYFHEVYSDGSGAIMDFHAALPARLKNRLDAACRDRIMQPGALKNLMYGAKKKFGNGAYQEAVSAFNHLENHLLVARLLTTNYPAITSVDPYSLGMIIRHVINGLPYRRLASDRKVMSGLLTAEEGDFAAATAYLVALDKSEETGVSRNITYKDAAGNDQYGTVLKNQTTADLLRTHPEKVFGVVDFILSRGELGGTKKDTEVLVAFLESETPNALSGGWA